MLNILFLIPTLGHGGAERVLVNLVNNLNKDKYSITVQTLFDEGINKQYLKSDIRYKSCFRHQFRGNVTFMKMLPCKWLHDFFIKEHYDIVVSYLEGPTSRIISGCPYKDTKKVYWIHIELDNKKRFHVGFSSFSAAIKAYMQADKVVFVAESVRSVFETTAGMRFPNGLVLYNTNETDKIKEKSIEKIDDVIFDANTVNVCSVAKIIDSKGYDRLAHVHNRLMKENIKHHIYILGVGERQKEIQEYINKENLSTTFSFLGFRENPYKYVAACDLYVCSSRREGFSTAVTEALIVGTPVVSTDCSGARELLGENNEYGIVTENSEEGIYWGMKKMLEDKDLRKHYAEKALERGGKFRREATVKAVEDMLDAL